MGYRTSFQFSFLRAAISGTQQTMLITMASWVTRLVVARLAEKTTLSQDGSQAYFLKPQCYKADHWISVLYDNVVSIELLR